jgi:hypothetical protein
VNYGAIGAVIGHEISHSFDDEGATFDATGKLANWWTPDDLAHFEQSCAPLAAQFDAYRPFPDLAVNGKQTLGENIADLGGLAAAYDAWHASLGGQPAPLAERLTGDQQFFASFAQAHGLRGTRCEIPTLEGPVFLPRGVFAMPVVRDFARTHPWGASSAGTTPTGPSRAGRERSCFTSVRS